MMNSFYWTQSLLVIFVAILAFFISFGPSQNRAKWITALGITASVALFVANQVVMSNTGDGLDKQLNCWIWPTGVACPKPVAKSAPDVAVDNAAPPALKLPASSVSYLQALSAYSSKDFAQARTLFERACDGGVFAGCHSLGIMLGNGEGGSIDQALARALYQKACDGAVATSCHNLGIMLGKGEGGNIDQALARALYQKACDGGVAVSCFNLGIMLGNGEGGNIDQALARASYKKACDGEEAAGCNSLGVAYYFGIGGDIDKGLAIKLYKQACDGGIDKACNNFKIFSVQ